MANFGDQYSYVIQFDARNVGDIDQSTRSLDHFGASVGRAGKVAVAAGSDAKRGSAGFKGASDNLASVAFGVSALADDIKYGSRAIANNVAQIIAAAGGYTVASQLLGGAASILIGVFRNQIDAGLEWAGILDENLRKNTEEATEATDSFRLAMEALNEEFATAPKAAREAADQIGTLFTDAGGEVTRRIVAALEPDGPARKELEKELADIRQEIKDLYSETASYEGASVGAGDALARRYRAVQGELKELTDKAHKAAVAGQDQLFKSAAKGDEQALQRLIALLDKIGGPDATRASSALWRLTEAGKAWAQSHEVAAINAKRAAKEEAKVAEEAKKTARELEEVAVENERNADAYFKKAEAAEEAARREMAATDAVRQHAEEAELDEQTKRVVEAFGPLLQRGIAQELQSRVTAGQGLGQPGVGGATDDVFIQVIRALVKSGVGIESARKSARQLVNEQSSQIQSFVDANNARAALDRVQLQNTGIVGELYQRQRAEMLRFLRLHEQQNRRLRQFQRETSPLGRLQGNSVLGAW